MRVIEWELTRKANEVGWLVMRVVKCRIHWFRHDDIAWTEDQSHAWCFKSREEAWEVKTRLGNAFLIIHGAGRL